MTVHASIVEALANPEGLIRIDIRLLKNRGKGQRYCFVKMSEGREEFKRGAYALINLRARARNGDRVLVGGDLHDMRIMRLRRLSTADGWCFEPLSKSSLRPWFVSTLDAVIGKVERIFDVGEVSGI